MEVEETAISSNSRPWQSAAISEIIRSFLVVLVAFYDNIDLILPRTKTTVLNFAAIEAGN